jgi:hypothetical protein
MPLTPDEHAFLTRFLRNRDQPPTVGRILASSRVWLATVLGMAAACAVGYVILDDPTVPAFGLGAAAGMLMLGVRQMQLGQQYWPLVAEVTDWKRVEELLAGDETHSG